MKVRDALNNPSGVSEVVSREDRKPLSSKGISFQQQLSHIDGQNYEEGLRKLAQEVIDQGKKLGEKIDVRELKIYKKLVAGFIEEAVGNSHKFSKQNLLDRRGRYKVFGLIKKVNEQLDGLTQDILSSEKDNIRILQRLDDIRGLILDVIL